MSAEHAGELVIVLQAMGAVAALVGWTAAGRRICPPLALAALVGALGVAGASHEIAFADGPVRATAVACATLLAVAGGGPVTALVFDLVDRGSASGTRSLDAAGTTLRGGAWIGCLERLGIAVSLLAGFPEGLAITLALKGLGRYPELRAAGVDGAAERFIIGTFTSVLWAAGCAGVVLLTMS